MQKISLLLMVAVFGCISLQAQELYVSTEPASNMPAKSIGIKLNNTIMPMQNMEQTNFRITPEIMFGINKNLMVHADAFISNMYQAKTKFEGASVYAKYRFYTHDEVHQHFRMAAFGKLAFVNNANLLPYIHEVKTPNGNGGFNSVFHNRNMLNNDLMLDGNHSGGNIGVVATQLIHKFAASATVSYTQRFITNNTIGLPPNASLQAAQYSVSMGYLLFPFNYESFKQVNVNLYAEFLGSSLLDRSGGYIDFAPAIQFIFDSNAKLNLSYRWQLNGSIERYNVRQYAIAFEWTFLNAWK
jgi:hypothetical protein